MKVVLHSSRGYSNTKSYGTLHNDRNFSCEAANITQSKTANNIVWLYYDSLIQGKENQKEINTIEECEKTFYTDNFTPWLNLINNRYLKNSHRERMMTMDKFRSCYRYCPEEVIFQIGSIGDCPSLKDFTFISYAFIEYLQKWSKNHQNAFSIIDWALHQDEIGAPHLHIRRVWHYVDEKSGVLQIGQEKVLKRIGYLPPFPSEEQSKYNNRKITYDQETRRWIIAFCRSLKIKVNDVPKEKSKVGLELSDYIIRQKNELKKREEKVRKDEYELLKKIICFRKGRKYFGRFVNNFINTTYKRYIVKLPLQNLKNEYEAKFNEVTSYILPIYEQDIVNNVKDYKNFFSSFSYQNKIAIDALNRIEKIEKCGKIMREDSIFFFNHQGYLPPLLKNRLKRKMDYYTNNSSDYFAYKSIVELNIVRNELLEKMKVVKKENYQSM